jgi:heme/copper-type cytochrome/quinol oxidase subunit 2
LNRPRALLVPAAVALALAACGSGKGSTSGSTSPSVASTAATVAAATTAPSTAAATAASPATTVPAGDTTPTDEAVSGDAQEIIVNVDDPSQLGQTFDVPLGQTVVLRLMSSAAQEYHLHGYDLEKQAAPGVEATFEFTADKAGAFEVESHNDGTLLATLQVS